MLDSRLLLTFSLVLFTFFLSAQETILSSGTNANGSGGSIAYSLGQVSIDLNVGNSGSVLQGVQQPYEIYTVGTDELSAIHLKLNAYPNPTSDQLVLTVEDMNFENLSYHLYNSTGKTLISNECDESITNINLNQYPSDTYLLSITNNHLSIKTFRIIKN